MYLFIFVTPSYFTAKILVEILPGLKLLIFKKSSVWEENSSVIKKASSTYCS